MSTATHSLPRRPFARAVALPFAVALWAAVLGCAPPPVSVRAPARIAAALTVIADLGATATLLRDGGGPLLTVELARGADGVTFSGFMDVAAGAYLLEIVYTGVAATGDPAIDDGARRFLGRLSSDSFLVVDGAVTTPVFSTALDVLGRAGDGADEDGDGLGFLDELLLRANPASPDSDGDGLADGLDCRPDTAVSAFAILEGGSFEDCDADGFRSRLAPFGGPGDDCDDERAAINPAATDDCDTNDNEDCNNATCPFGDELGPELVLLSPLDGAVIGCNVPFVVQASDPSNVASVSMSAPDDLLPGEAARFVAFRDDEDGLTWRAPNGFGASGAPLADGPFAVDITAVDSAANSNKLSAAFTLISAFPDVTLGGPSVILDGANVDIVVTPVGARELAVLELRAAPFAPDTGALVLAEEITLGALPIGGGTLSVSPDALPGDFLVYPFAVDDIGNVAAPNEIFPLFAVDTGINASFQCTSALHFVPAIARRTDIGGPVTMRSHLDDAIAAAQALEPTAFLTMIQMRGVEADGTVDLSRTDLLTYVSYSFMTPAQAALGFNAESVRVTWLSAAAAAANPFVDPTGSFAVDAIADVAGLLDSPAIVAAFPCGGLGTRGLEGDTLDYEHDVDGDVPNTDQFDMDTADTYEWISDATDLRHPLEYCLNPQGEFFCPAGGECQ